MPSSKKFASDKIKHLPQSSFTFLDDDILLWSLHYS